jgi:hypothetical protein
MAEVGLLAFAHTAGEVGRAVLPSYRTRFSKHQFTQPQLLAILCLLRYEDWTFREAEVRLGEHGELRQALGLSRVPDFTTLYRFLQRLDEPTIDRAVGETVRRMRVWRGRGQRRARVAVDATGLAPGAVSTFFCAAPASSRAKTPALAARAEVAGGGRSGSAVPALAERATRSVERRREFACAGRSGFAADAPRSGAGRRRIRQREESHLYPSAAPGAERDPRQAWEENLARARSACRNAARSRDCSTGAAA